MDAYLNGETDYGWICDPRKIDGMWLVCFDQYGDLPNIATIPVLEEDLKVIEESD